MITTTRSSSIWTYDSLRGQVLAALIVVLIAAGPAAAETHDFGGWEERFKGEGDMEPPQCQIEVPRTASAPFFVKWNCTDNEAPADEVRSELWVRRKGANAPKKLADFLGFPASVFIDEGVLETDAFENGLPADFRLVARDRAGVGVVTPYLRVTAQTSQMNICDLEISTEPTEATGDTTGLPAMVVAVDDAAVATQENEDSSVRVGTSDAVAADPCEIDSICANDSEITIQALISLGTGDDEEDDDEEDDESAEQPSTTTAASQPVSGRVTVAPGGVSVSVRGTGQLQNGQLTAIQVSGTTEIEGADTTVELNCSRRATVTTGSSAQ